MNQSGGNGGFESSTSFYRVCFLSAKHPASPKHLVNTQSIGRAITDDSIISCDTKSRESCEPRLYLPKVNYRQGSGMGCVVQDGKLSVKVYLKLRPLQS